ncbi:MAG: AMP-binding protein [Actinobacteria bacterium]|nr:AMP-binding protein [Actinomycetota bacterium]
MNPSIASGPTTIPLFEETIGQNLAHTALTYPDAEALVSARQGIRYTYSEFARAVDEMAKALLGLDVAKGERVGIWSPNNAEWVIVQYATARIGAVLVTINPAYRLAELEYVLNQSGITVLFSAESYVTSDYRAMIEDARDRSDVEHVIFLETADWQTLLERASGISDEDLEERSSALDPLDPINIQYTSGTTGFPKGATLSHRNILNNGFLVGEACRYTHEDRVCLPVPFYHCFGMVLGNLACTTHGACIVIPGAGFDPVTVLETVASERCTSLYGVPTMFIAELGVPNLDTYDLSSLRTGIMAGSPCPIEVMKQVVNEMHMSEVTIAYGMTETSPVSTQTSPTDPLDKRVSTVGKAHPHVNIKIVDPATGDTVPRGEGGELLTQGYSVMLGYWEAPEQTDQAIDSEGWMHTGDLAAMDEEGYVKIVGRIKDMIVRGGENVYPREIEEFLYGHPSIVEVQVIGIPDDRYGEEIMAWIQIKDGADPLTEQDVKNFCLDQIAHYKVPRYIKFVDEFPMTITGKIQKFKMREVSTKELGIDTSSTIYGTA